MFKVLSKPVFKTEVEVVTPEAHAARRETFTAHFRVEDAKTLNTFNLASEEGTTAFLRKVLVQADDLAGEDGEPLPWSEDVKEALLNHIPARIALLKAYNAGMTEAREKN